MPELKVGLVFSPDRAAGPEELRRTLAALADAGADHVAFGDHVSFHTGHGRDGLITAAMLAMLHPTLTIFPSVYLLPLRHPVPVARQLSTLSALAPGRLIFGVGIGGEDPHEVEICGVDPRTRGRRMDEALEILRGLLTGRPVTFHGRFFDLDEALVLPPPPVPIPIVVGGRSDAALRRTARFADGWLGIWNSPRRFAEAVELVEREAAAAGRGEVGWRHGMQVWCGIGTDRDAARTRLAAAMESTYKIPFERFERYSPYGRPEEVAEFLAAYVAAGCRSFNLSAVATSIEETVAAVGEIKRLLSGSSARSGAPLSS